MLLKLLLILFYKLMGVTEPKVALAYADGDKPDGHHNGLWAMKHSDQLVITCEGRQLDTGTRAMPACLDCFDWTPKDLKIAAAEERKKISRKKHLVWHGSLIEEALADAADHAEIKSEEPDFVAALHRAGTCRQMHERMAARRQCCSSDEDHCHQEGCPSTPGRADSVGIELGEDKLDAPQPPPPDLGALGLFDAGGGIIRRASFTPKAVAISEPFSPTYTTTTDSPAGDRYNLARHTSYNVHANGTTGGSAAAENDVGAANGEDTEHNMRQDKWFSQTVHQDEVL